MAHRWPADTDFALWELDVLDRDCACCGRMMHICDYRYRRELMGKRVWFAEALISGSADEVRRLIALAKRWAEALGKSVALWISDKQDAFVTGIRTEFPGVPHRYCANHFLRDLAKPVLEADSHAKVRMRKKVRGLRGIERSVTWSAGFDYPRDTSVGSTAEVTRGFASSGKGRPWRWPSTPTTRTRNHSRSTISSCTARRANPNVSFRRCAGARS